MKLGLAVACMQRWPTFSFDKEDLLFWHSSWNEKHSDARLTMWDDANVNLNYKPSLSHTHRLTCSPYCGSNCDEGPIFLQCCR